MYDFLNKEFFESALSKPVITIMPEEKKQREIRVLGWFTQQKVWAEKDGGRAYELNITADYADRPFAEITATLLHEMANQFAVENEIEDCSRSGSYHNKFFAKIASKHGLKVYKTAGYVFSKTTLNEEAEMKIKDFEFSKALI